MSATGTTVAVVVAALGSSTLTIVGTFGLDWIRTRRRAKENSGEALSEACRKLVGGALILALRLGFLHQEMLHRSGIGESIDIVMHHRKPADFRELGDWLLADQGQMFDAQTTIWLLGDAGLIKQAAEVIEAARIVVGRASSLSEAQQEQAKSPTKRFLQLKPDPDGEREIVEAVRRLGQECRSFVSLVRGRLKTDDLDALLRSFPTAPAEANDDGVEGSDAASRDFKHAPERPARSSADLTPS